MLIIFYIRSLTRRIAVPLNLQSPSSASSISCSISVHLVDSGTVQQVQDHVDAEASQRQKLAGVRDIFKALLGMGTAVSEVLVPFLNTHQLLNVSPAAQHVCEDWLCLCERPCYCVCSPIRDGILLTAPCRFSTNLFRPTRVWENFLM